MRSRARRPAVNLSVPHEDEGEIDLWSSLLREETTPEDIFDKKQLQMLVRDVVDELPENSREILILAYFNQFSYKEMADMLKIPLGTVKSRLHAAVGAFAKRYKDAVCD